MGIAIWSLEGLLARVQAWLAPAPAPQRVSRPVLPVVPAVQVPACRRRPSPRLRIVRVIDRGQAPASAGRMVISGRLADVCAELDRLAALEAAAG